MANFSDVFSAPENTFDILTNTEFKFGNIINQNGEEAELTKSTYSLYLKNSDVNIRKQAFDLMYKKYSEFINTISEIYMANVKIKIKKAALIYELLEMIRATLFRQSMFAEFEKIVHEKTENGEILTSENLNNIYYNLNKKYFGDDIFIDEKIKYEWARIPHFYTDFLCIDVDLENKDTYKSTIDFYNNKIDELRKLI